MDLGAVSTSWKAGVRVFAETSKQSRAREMAAMESRDIFFVRKLILPFVNLVQMQPHMLTIFIKRNAGNAQEKNSGMTHDEVTELRFDGKGIGLWSECGDPSLFP